MILAPSEPRCRGRCGIAFGMPTLALECQECVRRTDIPPGVTVRWLTPPSKGPICAKKVYPDDGDHEGWM